MTLNVRQQVSLRQLNTLAVECSAAYLVDISAAQHIPEAVEFARSRHLPIMVLGAGSNILFSGDYTGVVLNIQTRGVTYSGNGAQVLVEAAAGENWHQLVMNCLQRGYYGIENLALIPGTVGAAPVQNIGAYGVELDSVVEAVHGWHMESKCWMTLSREQCEFAYRDSIFKRALRDHFVITSVTLNLTTETKVHTEYAALSDYLDANGISQPTPLDVADAVIAIRRSKLPDPEEIPNAGSFFKNPVISAADFVKLRQQFPGIVAYPVDDASVKLAAGWLMEQAGWKGVQQDGVGFHAEQALVLVNPGAVGGAAVMAVADAARRDVQDKFGVTLEVEPRIY